MARSNFHQLWDTAGIFYHVSQVPVRSYCAFVCFVIEFIAIAKVMITTVTTTTTTVVMLQQALVVAAFGVVVLIGSLVVKELLSSTRGKTKVSSLAGRLKIAILPLFFAFAVILAMRIWEAI